MAVPRAITKARISFEVSILSSLARSYSADYHWDAIAKAATIKKGENKVRDAHPHVDVPRPLCRGILITVIGKISIV